jgi:hypothetical protein
VANTLDPYTEADKNAILVSFLTAFGAAVGNRVHAVVAPKQIPPALYVVIFGETGIARKSTAINFATSIIHKADDLRIIRGIPGSGEAMIDLLCPPPEYDEAIDGPYDGRYLFTTDEFASILEIGKRSGTTVNQVVRQMFDQDDLYSRSRATGEHRASGYHAGILSAITTEELVEKLSKADITSGSANRFMYFYASSSKMLPEGDMIPPGTIDGLVDATKAALRDAKHINLGNGVLDGPMTRTEEAKEIWNPFYYGRGKDKQSPTAKALLQRADGMVLRTSLIYACMDRETNDNKIHAHHVKAALAVWKYAEESVKFIYRSEATNDPASLSEGAKKLLAALAKFGERGLTRTEQFRDVFQSNTTATTIGTYRKELIDKNLAEEKKVNTETSSKPTHRLIVTERGQKEAGRIRK